MTEAQHDDVPGTVVHHSPASSGRYNGCPSIVALPSGNLVASHSYFGPDSAQRNSFIYASPDGGASWERIAALEGQIWSKLFLHHPDPNFHAFQYVDWDFDGDNIVFLSRTAHDDGLGGAHNAHDANYTTFHRLDNFRQYINA